MPPEPPKIQPRVPGPKPYSTKRQAPGPADNTYTVMPGDTLSGIARQTGRGLDDLATWNDLVPPYQVEVGQVLKLTSQGKTDRTKTRRKSNASNLTAKKSIMSRSETGKAHRNDAASGKAFSGRKNKAELKFAWPLTGKIQKNFAQTGRKGINIAGKTGQTVRAAEAGKVVYSGQGLIGYGNLLIIKHNDEYLTAYANNSALLAREGDVVKKGQEIAKVGPGTSRRAMLHFEIRRQGKSVNPLNFLPKI
ncbi:MAG: peptidoglycan DD-metalloendopeptidase family protein [Gammaproteobacteria bacterium]